MGFGPEDSFDPPQGSPIPEITDEELRRHVVATRRDITAIRTALTGNDLGTQGVLPRLAEVETKVEKHDRKLMVWGSILTVAGTALVFLKDLAITRTK